MGVDDVYRLMMKRGHGSTKLLHWGAFDHACTPI